MTEEIQKQIEAVTNALAALVTLARTEAKQFAVIATGAGDDRKALETAGKNVEAMAQAAAEDHMFWLGVASGEITWNIEPRDMGDIIAEYENELRSKARIA